MKSSSFIFVLSALLCLSLSQGHYEKQLLMDGWKVNVNGCPRNSHEPQKTYELDTNLPTTIHLDLQSHKKIPDPFISSNWQQLKWISQCNAYYKKAIQVTKNMLSRQVINLVFEGIDTYSTIKLNSQQILTTRNAFVQYRVDVKHFLKQGQNVLEVQINSTKGYDSKGQSQDKMPFDFAHTRKASYQYSWDWAPYMNTLGIWKDVYLELYDEVSIDYVWVQIERLDEIDAMLRFALKVKYREGFEGFSSYQYSVQHNGKELNRSSVAGPHSYLSVKIDKPKLWWPNGLGESFVYDFTVKLISGQKVTDSKIVLYGIRTVRLDQTSNAFTIVINGYKVYAKGANYIPPDMLYPRLTNPSFNNLDKFQTILKDCVRSNFNMIRIWGGGQYQNDKFYEMASRMGIMLFHDFMFSESSYPSNDEFLDNILPEIVQQVRRIRNYPALVLWSGNNQVLEGITNEKQKQNYKKLFEEFIPKIIQTQTPYIPYIPSSPVYGSAFQKGGDVHYWGVWAAGQPFQQYETAVGRFNSEFGTQGLPVWQTIRQFTSQNGRSYSSKELLSHQRHSSQFHTLRKYMQLYAKQARNFELQTYQSGLVQAYGIEIAIKAQRASKTNQSMGTLYWQLNDAWPAISWSAIDYYGRWKPLQYKAKNLYEDAIAYYYHRARRVYAINDKLYRVNCYVETKAMTFEGEILKSWNATVGLRQNEAREVFKLDGEKDLFESKGSKIVIHTKLYLSEDRFVTVDTFLQPFKNLELPRCPLHVKYFYEQNSIKLAAKCLLKNLHIYHTDKYLTLSDNYIDIVPGEIYTVQLLEQKLENIVKGIKYRSYLQVTDQKELEIIVEE